MIKYVVSGLLVALAVFAFRTAQYVGAFKDVEISVSEEAAKNLIYKTHVGAYHKIVPVIEEVETWAREQKIDCHLSFGEYIDNPDTSEEDRLKSHGGCIVTEIPPNLPAGFEGKTIPAQKFVKAVFDGSPGIGPLKVYPRVQKYADEHKIKLKGTVIESYEIHRDGALAPETSESEKHQVKMTTFYYFFID